MTPGLGALPASVRRELRRRSLGKAAAVPVLEGLGAEPPRKGWGEAWAVPCHPAVLGEGVPGVCCADLIPLSNPGGVFPCSTGCWGVPVAVGCWRGGEDGACCCHHLPAALRLAPGAGDGEALCARWGSAAGTSPGPRALDLERAHGSAAAAA